jgi:hypothetical protein
MDLITENTLNKEIVHFYEEGTLITSSFNKVHYSYKDNSKVIILPQNILISIIGKIRIIRRLLRWDKCNIYPSNNGLIIIRKGYVYFYDFITEKLSPVLKLKNCRNILHQSIAQTPGGDIYFGEYGSNPDRISVPVYRSPDGGKSWQTIYEFAPGAIRHVHACCYDPYEDKIWVCTGDFGTENKIAIANRDFSNIEFIGDGFQKFRACNFFFTQDEVHWLMDSQLETSYHLKLARDTRKVEQLSELPGPVWYSKQTPGGYFAATAQEIGPGVKDEYTHLLFSDDLTDWRTIRKYKHDIWPRKYFKSGVIGFSEGKSQNDFFIFFEALSKVDGKSERVYFADK